MATRPTTAVHYSRRGYRHSHLVHRWTHRWCPPRRKIFLLCCSDLPKIYQISYSFGVLFSRFSELPVRCSPDFLYLRCLGLQFSILRFYDSQIFQLFRSFVPQSVWVSLFSVLPEIFYTSAFFSLDFRASCDLAYTAAELNLREEASLAPPKCCWYGLR